MCFVWERVQPTFQQPLSSTEVTRIKAALTSAYNHGIKVVLAAFNRQGYVVGTSTTSSQFVPFSITQTVVTQAAFADFWSRMATAFAGSPGLYAYEPCSEPIPPPDATLTGPTLVTNGGFESGTSGWTVTGGTAAIDTTNQHSGSQCLQVTATGGAPIVIQSPLMPITYTNQYYANGWLKLISTSQIGATFSVQIDWYNASNSYLATASGNTQAAYGGVPSAWNFSSAVSTTSAPSSGATQAKVKFYTKSNMSTNDVICMDDVGLWQATQCWTRQQVWQSLSQAAVTAIRNAGDTATQIWIPTWNGDLVNAVANHPTWWITDPSNNTVETVHHYWNHANGVLPGPYTATYGAEITADRNAGY
jgi:hypothetical protein